MQRNIGRFVQRVRPVRDCGTLEDISRQRMVFYQSGGRANAEELFDSVRRTQTFACVSQRKNFASKYKI